MVYSIYHKDVTFQKRKSEIFSLKVSREILKCEKVKKIILESFRPEFRHSAVLLHD